MAPTIATRRYANVVWAGFDLCELLESVEVRPEAKFLWSFGLDKGTFEDVRSTAYVKDMPLDRLYEGDVLLAYEMNGEPLDSEHGFPLRLIIPGYYGTNAVKWLYRLELADQRPDGPFTTKYYNDPCPSFSGKSSRRLKASVGNSTGVDHRLAGGRRYFSQRAHGSLGMAVG